MSDLLVRVGILLLVALIGGVLFWAGRVFVANRKKQALAAAPLEVSEEIAGAHKVRILAFSTADCTQCHTLQMPALSRLLAKHAEYVDVVHVDAANSPELTSRYHVLTVPSTVVLNPLGEVSAVNYGFANTSKLEQQVDALLVH